MSTNSLIGGLIGGVAGFFIGGPAGAMVGAGIGMGLGAALTPMPGMSQQGPRLSDLKVQTSTYGAAIPRVYGTVGITGNVIWLEGNKLKEVVTRRKVKAGGKGGSKKTTVTTYTYYATLAIGLCEGPIAGVRRIWAGPKLIYDAASDDLETIIASNQNAAGFSIYLGSADQQPDSRIQADRGVANTPAYRGLAYVVIRDFLLTEYGNAIPAFKVEVIKLAITQGLRTISLVDSGVTYRYSGIAGAVPGVGRPYITAGNGSSFVQAGGFEYIHASGGAFTARRLASKILPQEDGGWYYIGHLADGRVLRIQRIGSAYAAGDVQAVDQATGVAEAIHLPNAAGLQVDSITCSQNGRYIIAIYIDTATYARTFDLVGDSFASIRSGSADGAGIAFQNSYGRSAQYNFVSSCVSNDGSRMFVASSLQSRVLEYAIGDALELVAEEYLPGGFTNSSIAEADGAVYVASGVNFGVYAWSAAIGGQMHALADVVSSECHASGLLGGADVDASALAGEVLGYRVSNAGSIRSALEPLQAAFPFDAYQSGYQIKFLPRGQSSVATIDIAELGVAEQLPQSRQMDSQLPARLSVSYLDQARNYDANEQFAERINTEAVNDSELELAVVMTSSQAAQVAERLLHLAWLGRASFGPFQLPPTYRQLEASDVITIDAGYAQYEIRLTEVSYNADGSLTCSGAPNNASVYVSEAASDETPSQQTIALGGQTLFVPLDIPLIDETIQDAPGFVGAVTGYTNGWPGAVATQSVDGGQTWAEVQAFDGRATIGYVAGLLAANSCALIDEAVLAVSVLSGELESVSEAQMLAGTNWAAYGADGRWEIVRFRDAVLQADGSYLLSGFKRGDRGTEWATGLHQAGDLFVPLDDGDLAAIGMPVESIGVASTWRGVTAGDTVDSASDAPFTYRGVNLECLSPVYPVSTRNGSGDLSLSWTRRSRLSSSWWATGAAAPLGEASEAYEIDILSGSTVVRTISSSAPSMTYTAAQQTADFGSAQASISARIYQLSAVVGRGLPLEGTY